jgi:branched-chain amino acid transport system permease protein
MNPVIRLAAASAVLAAALALPQVADKGVVFLAGVVWVHMVFGFSWNLMFGQTGLVSFGHAAFFAIGGYAYAVLARGLPGMHPLLAFAAAGVVSALAALAVGVVALRRSLGVYFAILSLALSQIVAMVISGLPSLGRDDGFTGITRPVLNLGFTSIRLADGDNYYRFLVLCCALLTAVLWWVTHSRVGRSFRAIQQDPERAGFLGIAVARQRLLCFTIAACTTGLAGAVFGPWLQLLTPELAHWTFSARPILYTLLGGVGSFWGPAVGALGFAVLEYATRTLHGISEITIGGILLLVVLVFPGGLIGSATRLVRRT